MGAETKGHEVWEQSIDVASLSPKAQHILPPLSWLFWHLSNMSAVLEFTFFTLTEILAWILEVN